MKTNWKLYKQLLDMPGIAGHEKMVRKFVKEELSKYSDEIIQDKLGGVFGTSKGEGPTIMICGHMDEVGFMVSGITPQGMIKLLAIGGINPEVYLSQNMNIIINNNKQIKGIIGALPPHLSKSGSKEITAEDLLLDVGADSGEHAIKMGIKIGQQIVSENNYYITEDGKKIVSKAWDNRFGVGMCLEVMKAIHNKKHPNTVICGATVQEEVGLRGAIVASTMVKPDLFIAVDVSPANDYLEKNDFVNGQLGKGFLIRYYDPRCIMNPALHNYFDTLATSQKIPHQEFKSSGGTDAASAQYAGNGTLSTTIGLPGRYIHSTSSMVHVDDIEAVKKMIIAVINSFDEKALLKIKKNM